MSLLISLIAIVLLTAGYEWVRDMSRRYEQSHNAHLQAFNTSTQRRFRSPPNLDQQLKIFEAAEESRINEISSLLSPGKDARTNAEKKGVVVKAAFYAAQVFYSFFIM